MFEGYLELGGNEVLNSARALGYTQTAPCQVNWLICPPCDGVRDAIGDGPYVIDTISSAPWYDEDDEPTHRFYGAHAVTIEGLQDSSRTAETAEGIGDGGVVGRIRYATKRIRVRAMLSARGKDALAAGFSWLDAVLRPGACGQHGNACGASDAGFYVACPPPRNSITSPVGITFQRVEANLLATPQPNLDWELEGLDAVMVADPDGGDYMHATVTGSVAYVNLTGEAARIPVTRQPITFQAEVRLGEDTTAAVMRVLWMDADGNFIVSGTQDGVPTMNKDWQRIAVTGEPPVGAKWVGAFLLLASELPTTATVDVRKVMAQRGRNLAPYFDGDTPDVSEMDRYVWTGEPNNSISAHEVGEEELAPDQIVYNRIIDSMQRSLHNVTCVSGPTIEETMNRGDAWGYIVEFVLVAATPWIFSNTRPIDLPPSLPVVVQDLPFNLVPYPSAELASGSVLVATNYTANPSAEPTGTGWYKGSNGDVVTGDVTGTTSTAISSVGDYSYLSHFVAGSAGASGTVFVGNNSTTFPAVTAGTRMSVTMWVAAQVVSGTAVLGSVEVFAHWQAGGSTVRSDLIGTIPAGSGAATMKSISPPVGATGVVMHGIARLTNWTTGAVVDVYGDAVAVTVP